MQRIFVLLAIVGMARSEASAQSKNTLRSKTKSVDKIHFFLKAASGTHEIRTEGENPINIMGHHDRDHHLRFWYQRRR